MDISRQLKRVIKLYKRYIDADVGYKVVTDGTTKLALITNETKFRTFYETPDTTFAGAMAFRCEEVDGTPLAGAVITIQKGTETAIVLEATDVNGLTGIPGLKNGEYVVTVTTTPEGFETPTISNITIDDSIALRNVAFTATVPEG